MTYSNSNTLTIVSVLIAVSAMSLVAYQSVPQKERAQPQFVAEVENAPDSDVKPDGLPLDNIDAVGRVHHNGGTGTCCIGESDANFYYARTNFHVAGGVGSICTIEFWNDGELQKPVRAEVVEAYFDNNKSKDISILKIRKSDLAGPMPVIPFAPYGNDAKLKVGDRIWQVGNDSGRWTNAERGRIVKLTPGLIYYLPKSIPGNSGGPVYDSSGRFQIGVTAWYTTIEINGKPTVVGLAMSSDRVRDFRAGRASSFNDALPANTHIASTASDSNLPVGATQVPFRSYQQTENKPGFKAWRNPGSTSDEHRKQEPENDSPKSGELAAKAEEVDEAKPTKKSDGNLLIWIAIAILAYLVLRNKA